MNFDKYVENIPEWAMVYLFNGDAQGLSDEEKQAIDEFEHDYEKISDTGRVAFDCLSIDPFFSHYPAFGLPSNCYEVEVLVEKNS